MSDLFKKTFGRGPQVTIFAPGRVNLIGEYTDLVGGSVLPMPLRKGITVSASRADQKTLIHSALRGETIEVAEGRGAKDHWTDYVIGPLALLKKAGIAVPPLTLCIESDLPAGAGVSSSAALEIAVIRAVLQLLGENWPPEKIARLAQRAENEFCGVQCGIMDQMAVAAGKAGHALALDCDTLLSRQLPIPDNWCFAIAHCGEERQLTDGAYNQRRAAVDAAEVELGVGLRDLALATVEKISEPLVRQRARHIVSEEMRVLAAMTAMEKADAQAFGRLMDESHTSLALDFDVSTPALNDLVSAARKTGAKGARLTGAGFGGCIVALIDAGQKTDWWANVSKQSPNAWLVQI